MNVLLVASVLFLYAAFCQMEDLSASSITEKICLARQVGPEWWQPIELFTPITTKKLQSGKVPSSQRKTPFICVADASDKDTLMENLLGQNVQKLNNIPSLANHVVPTINPLDYPQASISDIVDDYHGIKIPDPYRGLEDPEAEQTKQFVKKVNAISEPFLKASPIREQLRIELTELLDYERFGCPVPYGDFYYYFHNTGLQNHSVLYQQKSLEEKGTVFLDPNTFSEDGTTALRQTAWTEDGEIMAYGISEKGSDSVTVKFKKANGEEIPEQIPGLKFSGLAWLHNNTGLFYSKFPSRQNVNGTKHKFHSLYFHRMGTDAKEEDILVIQCREDPNIMISAFVSEDGSFLFVNHRKGTDPSNQLFYFDLSDIDYKITGEIQPKPLFNKFDARYTIMDSDNKTALILTNHGSPMNKLVRIRLDGSEVVNQNDVWEEVIGEDQNRKLEWVWPVDDDKMIVCYMEDVKNTLYIHDLKSGKQLYQLPLGIGSFAGGFARKNSSELFLAFTSFLAPSIMYHGNFSKNVTKETPIEMKVFRQQNVKGLNSEEFVVKQEFYQSKDGTRVPMYIIHRKDMLLDGTNGALLYGYGGFGISLLPHFSVSRLMFVKKFNAVMAIANIRGGSEYGEKWHEASMREHKQNGFDDFIAAAEFLIHNKYTNSKKLAIEGGSNGGLLTAVCSQQRPDLFGAVVTEVGVLDMLRFPKFTIGHAWVPEYGNPEDPEHFPFIYKYSPLHQLAIKSGQQWPSTLLLTADHDDRVVPMHTLKYIAQLYHLLAKEAKDWQQNPVLAQIEENAGHGGGKPMRKQIDQTVDIYSFLQQVLGLVWTDEEEIADGSRRR